MNRSFVSPSRYEQRDGLLEHVGSYAAGLGERVLVVTDERVHDLHGDTIDRSLSAVPCNHTVALSRGYCTTAEIERLSEVAREERADVIVGAGGGQVIDLAKAVRSEVDGRLVSVPTIASSDAPTSGLSVVYTDDRRIDRGLVHDRRPDVVLVDTGVIAGAPTRWLQSGIGDALATRFEARATAESGGQTVAGGTPTAAGLALADRCYATLREHATDAVNAANEGIVTAALEQTVEAIILLSGLGFENGGLACAHAVHDGITNVVRTEATHGEKVCFGLLTQLVLEGHAEGIGYEVAQFAHELSLPVSLSQIGIDPQQVDDIAEATCTNTASISNQADVQGPADVCEAMFAADELGRSLL